MKDSGCLKSLWGTLLAPIIVGVVIALLAGRLVIQISGFQFSIGLTILIALVFFVVIVVAFFFGMAYLIFGGLSLLLRTEMPWAFRMATKLIFNPGIWIYSRVFSSKEDREADKHDIAEAKAGLAQYHARIDPILAKIRDGKDNESPS